MNELQHRVLRVLAVKDGVTSKALRFEMKDLTLKLGGPLKALQNAGFVRQQAVEGRGSLWHITQMGREEAEKPFEPKKKRKIKNDWEKLNWQAQALLRELATGRPVYKRRAKWPCLERPIAPFAWAGGLAQLIKLSMVERTGGDLTREIKNDRFSWSGAWGRFIINEEGQRILALAPPKEV